MAEQHATVDEYIGSFPPEVQRVLDEIRRTIHRTIPDAEERISYNIPTFTLDGRYVVYFAGWKGHVSVYPVPGGDQAFEQDIAPYRSGKGTLKFRLDAPIPYDLIERLATLLAAERAAR
jgi:uncharacterized protein YdhG (YjbR/CyaY superfamily)